MKILLPTIARTRIEIAQLLVERGFVQASDRPVTWGIRWTTWERGEDAIGYGTRAESATAAIKIVGPGEDSLAAELRAVLPSRVPAELLVAPRDGASRARIRHAFDLSTLVWLGAEGSSDAKQALFAMLRDGEDLVRWAALQAVSANVDREVEAAVGAAAEQHADLRPAHERIRATCDAIEEGTLGDHDTDDRFELLRRAEEGAQAGKWKRVAKAMDLLLADSAWNEEGLYWRGLAHEADGEVLEALFLLGAAERELLSAEAVRRASERDDEDEEDDGLDEDELDHDGDLVTERVAEVRAKLPELRARAADVGAEARDRAIDLVLRYLRTWEEQTASGSGGASYGGARALRGTIPALDGLLAFIEGRWDKDEKLLSEALRAAPDAPSVELTLAYAVMKRDEAEGEQRLVALRERLRAGVELSTEARLIEEVVAARGEEHVPSEAGIVESLARSAYDAKRYDEAAALADELCLLAPDTGYGWQVRANARIFALRHEESIVAYDEAIAALDRIYERGRAEGSIFFGGDARPGMYFNRGCAQAKVGRNADALASLRVAIREDEKYAAMAVEDDYLASLFDDPEFRAIVAREPRALRTAEERDPAWIKARVAKAREQQQAGDIGAALETAKRAFELAGFVEDLALQVEALAVLGRMQTFSGDMEEGLASTERAVLLADDPAVPAETRALASAQRGICLQAAERLDEAEAAYQQAFEARRAAFGEDHPVLVKSLGAVAGVAIQRGRPAAEIEGLITRGVDIAQRYLASTPPRDHVWAEAIDDLVSLLVRRAMVRSAGGATADAVQALALALDRLEEQRAAGAVPMAAVVEQIRTMADEIVSEAPSPEVAEEAGRARSRSEALLVAGPPEERRVRLVFHRLRGLVGQLRMGGVDDARIASILGDLVRGGDALPEQLRNVPVLAELRAVLATAAARESTVLVTSAMALSVAAMPGELDRALRDLEELVAPVVAQG